MSTVSKIKLCVHSLIVLLGACCVPSGLAGTDHDGGSQVENGG